ncbi:MAG: NACHT domain-containing protein [Burkholderiales bacterium]|nr:NACHT domain-containing protein [Burkholderiales bacterium]
MLAKALPEHWQRRTNERLGDFNPYNAIAGNHDLMRAARLAWIKAALEVLNTAKECAQSSGREFGQKNEILRFESVARQSLIKIRSDALDRRAHPGATPIDTHLKTIIEGTSEFTAPDENPAPNQSPALDFDKTLAAITGWPVHELPAMFKQIARDGLPTVDQGAKRPFGELVFAAFAEILKSPDQYPEAGAAFTIAQQKFVIDMQKAARKLSEEILEYTKGIDDKVDQLIALTDALAVFQTGARTYLELLPRLLEGQARLEALALTTLNGVQAVKADTEEIKDVLHRIEQSAKSNPAASEEEMLAEYSKLLAQLDQREFKQILNAIPESLNIYRAQCIARWSQPRYAIDKQFTPLTLLLDQGDEHEGERYQRSQEYRDLRDILTAVDAATEPVIIVTGGPGSGKSTLLRRLELDLASSALRSEDVGAPLTIFLPLNDFGDKNGFPKPLNWIKEYWNQNEKFWLSSEDLLRQPLILLLDGLNEMPRVDRADYDDRLAAWKNFLNNLALNHPSVRVIFSCRTLDYGTKLTTKDLPRVPQVEITPLDNTQVEKFLQVYSPDTAAHLWNQLNDSEQLDLYRSPYYLKLLIDQTSDGRIPEGRAALFTGFVRAMLKRENNNNRLRDEKLLHPRDRDRIGEKCGVYELPKRGLLFNALASFAFQLQRDRNDGDTGNTGNKMQVRIDFDGALDCLSTRIPDESQCENLLNVAVDLQILDMPGDDVLFVHQLLQEYFAARHLAAHINTAQKADDAKQSAELVKLAETAWLEADISPTVQEELATLPRSGTLPDLPTTGWEETFMLAAAAMTDTPDDFLHTLAQANLPLAGALCGAAGCESFGRVAPRFAATIGRA